MTNALKKILLIVALVNLMTGQAGAFSFSEYERTEQHTDRTSKAPPPDSSKMQCLAGKKIAVVIGEQHSQGWARTGQSAYGPLIEELNGQFKKLGLKTYSPEEIKQQVAQAEQEAFLANNLEAAVSAAGRLSADFMIRGIISTKIQKNPFVGIDEVFVTLSLTLVDRDGQNISSSTLSEAMFSDADTVATVHKLVREKAEQIIVNLYSECCKGLSGK